MRCILCILFSYFTVLMQQTLPVAGKYKEITFLN